MKGTYEHYVAKRTVPKGAEACKAGARKMESERERVRERETDMNNTRTII